jgi:hypothetical protein
LYEQKVVTQESIPHFTQWYLSKSTWDWKTWRIMPR